MIQYMDIFESPCIETRRLEYMNNLPYKTSMFQYMEIFESPCIETRRLEYMNSLPYKISMFQYMEIFESLCIETQRLRISVFYTQRFLNLHVLKYGDSKM